MPRTQVVIYKEVDGSAPLVAWLDSLAANVQDKCIAKIELLRQKGHELRRPHCDYLNDGVYELRIRRGNVNYRILYCFCGEKVVLLSHGCTKERSVPPAEIARALRDRLNFERNPIAHTYRGEL